jgi:hypothetical protein
MLSPTDSSIDAKMVSAPEDTEFIGSFKEIRRARFVVRIPLSPPRTKYLRYLEFLAYLRCKFFR